jgi:prepilin-type N-terminal cleavage/methylation domain-containing protein
MKTPDLREQTGFTLAEMLVAVAAGSLMLAAIIAASISMQKSLNAADSFFSTHMQQIRIIDYLSRDVKRAYIVTTSADQKTVTCIVPNYLSSNTRTIPTVRTTQSGTFVSYPGSRSVMDAVITGGSATLTSATANFTSSDVGESVAGTNIASGTTIAGVTNSTTATLSANATATASSQTITFGATTVIYNISGNAITRTENAVVTNIAYSTNSTLVQTSDVTLTNTEYTNTTVTFLPIFTSGNTAAEQSGTTVYGTAYLRNKRRG